MLLITCVSILFLISTFHYFTNNQNGYSQTESFNKYNFCTVHFNTFYQRGEIISKGVTFSPNNNFYAALKKTGVPKHAFTSQFAYLVSQEQLFGNKHESFIQNINGVETILTVHGLPIRYHQGTWYGKYHSPIRLDLPSWTKQSLPWYPFFNHYDFFPNEMYIRACGLKGCITKPVSIGIHLVMPGFISTPTLVRLNNKSNYKYFEFIQV